MYQFLWRRECKPSLSVISAAFIALGRSLEENIQKSVQQCSVHVMGVPGSSPTPALNPQSYLWPPRGSGLQPWNSPSFFLPSLSLHSHSSTLGKPIGSTCKIYLESDHFSLGLLKLLLSWSPHFCSSSSKSLSSTWRSVKSDQVLLLLTPCDSSLSLSVRAQVLRMLCKIFATPWLLLIVLLHRI